MVTSNPLISLEEIGEKITENSNVFNDNKTNELMNPAFPLIEDGNLVFKKFIISTKEPDNFVLLNGGVAKVEAFSKDVITNEILIVGRLYRKIELMFQAPQTTQRLLLVSSLSELQTLKVSDLLSKAVMFDHSDGIFIQSLIT